MARHRCTQLVRSGLALQSPASRLVSRGKSFFDCRWTRPLGGVAADSEVDKKPVERHVVALTVDEDLDLSVDSFSCGHVEKLLPTRSRSVTCGYALHNPGVSVVPGDIEFTRLPTKSSGCAINLVSNPSAMVASVGIAAV